MITQTLAMFADAYRELNARKMFWIVLILSALVVLVFMGIGIADDGNIFLFGLKTPFDTDPADRAGFYKTFFNDWGVTLWLSILASLLALISTAAVFPEFVSGGSIDLYLSKPISRVRLFLTKYVAALLFVALQVLVFSLASFLVIGVRGGAWEPRIFLAVPLVVCFFSYLFSISVLLGMLTRSTLAALLLTLLAWFGIFILDQGEIWLLMFKTASEREWREAATADETLKIVDEQIAYLEQRPDVQREHAGTIEQLRTQRDDLHRARQRSSATNPDTLASWHRLLIAVKSVLPKTRETTDLLARVILSRPTVQEEDVRGLPFKPEDVQRAQDALHSRSIRWVIGTSLAFEATVLVLAAWVFCRRDY